MAIFQVQIILIVGTKAIEVQVEQRFAERRRKFLQEGVTKNIPRLSPIFFVKNATMRGTCC